MADSKHEIETSSEDVEKYCDACKLSGETKLAIVYCETCKQFQCDLCNGMHQKFPVMFGHSIVTVEDKTEDYNCDFDMQGIDICGKHKEEIKFFCKAEHKLCCSKCVLSEHLKCDKVGEICEFTETNDDKMRELQDIIQAKLFTSAVHQTHIPRIQKVLREDQMHKLKEIDNVKDKFVNMFDTFRAEFKSKTDEAINDTCGLLDTEMTSYKQLDVNLRRTETFLDDVTKNGTPTQVFNALDVHKKQVDTIETSVRTCQVQLSTLKIDIEFHKKLLQCIEMTDEIATMTIHTIEVFTPKELRLEVSFMLQKSKNEKRLPLYTGLDYLPDGRAVAVDNHNYTCVVMDETMTWLATRVLEKKPRDIAVIKEGTVAISHGTELYLHEVNEDNTITHIRSLQTKSSYLSLYALHDDTLVASTFDCDRPVKLVTLTGEERDFDLPFPPTSYALYNSWCTFIPLLDMLVLTDRDADKCYLWNVKEKVKIVVNDTQIKAPRRVCATKSGLIFVCSEGTKSIVQISPTGQVLGSFHLDTNFITVAVSHDDTQLLVFTSDGEQRQLQLFKLT